MDDDQRYRIYTNMQCKYAEKARLHRAPPTDKRSFCLRADKYTDQEFPPCQIQKRIHK